MKDLSQYGNRREGEWEILPWIPDPRPPFKIWVEPEQIAPFFLIPHHPYSNLYHCDRDGVYLYIDTVSGQLADAIRNSEAQT